MDNVEPLRIDDLELEEGFGVGDVEIVVDDPVIKIRWHEDWGNSATTDRIELDVASGSWNHEHYYEDNFKGETHPVLDRDQTISTLREVVEHLGRSPQDHDRADRVLRKAIATVCAGQGTAGPS